MNCRDKFIGFYSDTIMEHTALFLILFCIYPLSAKLVNGIRCQKDLEKVEKGKKCFQSCQDNSSCGDNERCLCDGWCGKSCFNPNRNCEVLSPPRFGYITGTQRTYGHTVMYSCETGYLLNGPSRRQCRSDGKWTGTQPDCVALSTCGQAGNVGNTLAHPVQKVVNGQKAAKGAWPWQVLLIQNDRNKVKESMKMILGGGTVINRHWILTAAHLFDDHLRISNNPKDWLYLILFVLGISEVPPPNQLLPSHAQIYSASDVKRHPDYNKSNFHSDIALIRVNTRMITIGGKFKADNDAPKGQIQFTSFVRPVCLPCINDRRVDSEDIIHGNVQFKNFDPSKCDRPTYLDNFPTVVTGFGVEKPMTGSGIITNRGGQLLQGILKIHRPEICREGAGRIRRRHKNANFTDRMLCTGSDDSLKIVDACLGDSGGPLIQQMTSQNGSPYWVQVGIVSWGWGCAKEAGDGFIFPGFFTDISTVMSWVAKVIFKGKNTINSPTHQTSRGNTVSTNEPQKIELAIVFLFSKQGTSSERSIIEVVPASTIKQLKEKIEDTFNHPVETQTIFSGKNKLGSDNRTLDYYNIRNKDLVYVLIKQGDNNFTG